MAPKRKTTTSPAQAGSTALRKTRSRTAAAAPPSAAAGKRRTPPPPEAAKPSKRARASKTVKKGKSPAKKDKAPTNSITVEASGKSYTTWASQVKDALEKDVAGTVVTINPKKARQEVFEIREESGRCLFSLLAPFKVVKDLDMDAVITSIIKKIK